MVQKLKSTNTPVLISKLADGKDFPSLISDANHQKNPKPRMIWANYYTVIPKPELRGFGGGFPYPSPAFGGIPNRRDEISISFIYAYSTFTGGGSNEVETEISQNYPWWTDSTNRGFGGGGLLETIDIPEILFT